MNAAVRLGDTPGWRALDAGGRTLWLGGPLAEEADAAAITALAAMTPDSAAAVLTALPGHGALALVADDWTLIAVDAARSTPLLFQRDGDGWAISQRIADLRCDADDVDPRQARAFASSGFTLGPATLYRSIGALAPGEAAVLRVDGTTTRIAYAPYRPDTPRAAAPADLAGALHAEHAAMFDRLTRAAGGRLILAPLSAGYDSRLIVSGLKEWGYERVLCFAFGRPGNREAVASRAIAERLGYPWRFIPYDDATMRAHLRTPAHAAYIRHADSGAGMPFLQDHLALSRLIADGAVPDDAIVVNGQSGDFTSGNHIPPALFARSPDGADARVARIVDACLDKHYKHWRALADGPARAAIADMLRAEIDRLGGPPADPDRDFGLYEALECADRQAKYVVNGQRVYEALGLSWRLPLWDPAYLRFWESVPLAAKRDQKLYRDALTAANWGGVWRDIPLNARRRFSPGVAALRFVAKALHALPGAGGRAAWRRSERRFFEYFTEPLCGYAAWPYATVARDRRGHYSCIAWQIEATLRRHGRDWRGDRLVAEGPA